MVDKTKSESESDENSTHSFFKKVLISLAVAATITLLVLFVGYAINILLLVFLEDSMNCEVDIEYRGKTIV